jgi:hypothetical protein
MTVDDAIAAAVTEVAPILTAERDRTEADNLTEAAVGGACLRITMTSATPVRLSCWEIFESITVDLYLLKVTGTGIVAGFGTLMSDLVN